MVDNLIVAVLVSALVGVGTLILLHLRSSGPVLDTVKYRKFKLVQKTAVSPNTAIYRFALPRDSDSLGLPIGQHVSISAVIDGKEVVRSYTPVSTDAARGYFDLLVKAYPQGKLSKHISELKIGETISVRGPKGAFKYTPNMAKHIAMVAGGSGITPMYQVLQAIAANPEDKTYVSLIFANVSEVDIFLRKELDELVTSHRDQIKVHYVLNTPPEGWEHSVGFVTAEIMQRELPPPHRDHKLLLCGPLPMVSAVKKAAVEIGWDKASIKPDAQVFTF